MTNAMKLNRINDFELDNVVGGTVAELKDLVKACTDNPHMKSFVGIAIHLPPATLAAAYAMESKLSEMGIDANISVGVLGTGLFSKNNTYIERKTGCKLAHAEVVERVRNY